MAAQHLGVTPLGWKRVKGETRLFYGAQSLFVPRHRASIDGRRDVYLVARLASRAGLGKMMRD
jgi:hypothetical protein